MSSQDADIPQVKPLHGTLLALRQSDRLLLIRRTKEPYRGLLGLPGGKMEQGETPLAAARREMREETGLRRPKPAWLGRVTDLLIDGKPPHPMFILDVFEATLPEAVLSQPSFEGTIVCVPLDDLAGRREEIIPADLVIIRRLLVERSATTLDLVSVRRGKRYEVKIL